jgi:hypothetical protein
LRNAIAARNLNRTITSPAANVIEFISTPWPFVLGQAFVQVVILTYQLLALGPAPESRTKWLSLYLYNIARCLGAIVWMAKDIMVRETSLGFSIVRTPSVGIAQMFLGRMLSSSSVSGHSITDYFAPGSSASAKSSRLTLTLIGCAVSIVGFGLYTANGILSIIRNNFFDYYITVVVTQGCPSGLQSNLTISANPEYCAAIKSDYTYRDSSSGDIFGRLL